MVYCSEYIVKHSSLGVNLIFISSPLSPPRKESLSVPSAKWLAGEIA